MAAEESFFEFMESQNDKFVSIIIKLQAIIRGKCVRKQLNELRSLYENISKDIDGQGMEVVWSRNSLSLPVVKKGCAAHPAKDFKNSSCDHNSKSFQRSVASFVAPTHQSHQESQTPHPLCDLSENGNKDKQTVHSIISREVQTEYTEPTVAGAQSEKETGLLKKDHIILSAERDLPKHFATSDVQDEEVENINSHPASECSGRKL
ncbi:uncharacterized protein LOC131955874 [Physella acuta]|uniref:uncharacterized protein LOC131955874 n=1 Tax=Physella acuta TaxID=109671 RepID=UPI0027DBD3EA|nr:uncharacterized protein LOC131955874 [Physella acuta]